MKKFKFNLASLQVVRGWQEQKARQSLSTVNARVRQAEEALQQLAHERDAAFADWSLEPNRRFTAQERLGVDARVAHIDGLAAQRKKELAAAQDARAKAMSELAKASRELKVVENLREKRFQEHNAELERMEAAEIEDVFNARRSARSSV